MIKEKTYRRHNRYLDKVCGTDWDSWDEEKIRKLTSRKTKKHFLGTRRSKRRAELQEMRAKVKCQHKNWDTSWSPIVGEEWRSEPDYDFCVDCGMKEMEWEARKGNKFWQRYYPQRISNCRRRAIERMKHLRWVSEDRQWSE